MKFLLGAKLGDLIHSLVIPKYIYEKTGNKADLYISEQGDNFSTGLINTYKELIPVLKKQDYINSFEIYNNEKVDYNLVEMRNSPLLFKECWTDIYFSQFLPDEKRPDNYKWLSGYEDDEFVVMNRSLREMSKKTYEKYNNLLSIYKDVYFIYNDINQYNNFQLKEKVIPLYCNNLDKMVKLISESSLFIGNQSAPLAIASALNKNRIIELRNNPDAPHYEKETKYSNNLTTFKGD